LPFDRIKIDRSFVSSLLGNAESKAIVKAINGLGESLGLPITAEGIEDKDTENELRSIGCAQGQGWYYGRPLTVLETRKMLAKRNLLQAGDLEGAEALQADPGPSSIEKDLMQKAS
jgi:EAL domain-containing protein (putative c-di-GMP-specific phosphodiesterase class I)